MTAIRLTITMTPTVKKTLDKIRGDVKRSTYISRLIKQQAEKNV